MDKLDLNAFTKEQIEKAMACETPKNSLLWLRQKG